MAIQGTLMVQFYFDKKRPFAAGISMCGQSVGTVITLPMVSVLTEHYGIRGALVLHTGIVMQNIVFASLFRPIDSGSSGEKCQNVSEQKQICNGNQETERRTPKSIPQKSGIIQRIWGFIESFIKLWDFSLFKNFAFVQFVVAFAIQVLSTSLMYRFTLVKAVAAGVSPIKASFLLSITGK